MAKWGEGDPRWIVEERPDGTNVNNWHWVEKNATQWSKDKIRALLVGAIVEDDECFCEIKELTTLDGEATANNRKAKLIFFYEFEIKGKWTGKLKHGDTKYKGKFDIPNLSEENKPEEIDLNVQCDKDTDEAFKVKECMRKRGTEFIQKQAQIYITSLKEEYGQGIILPTKGSDGPQTQKVNNETSVNEVKREMNKLIVDTKQSQNLGVKTNQSQNLGVKTNQSQNLGVKIKTKKLTTKDEFKCRAEDIYRALTDKQMVAAFTSGPAEVSAEKGGRFSLMGGNVTGEFINLVPAEKIEMRWRLKSWPSEHYSTVTIRLVEDDGCTKLNLEQVGVPESHYEVTLKGWQHNYFERIKGVFGFGSRLF